MTDTNAPPAPPANAAEASARLGALTADKVWSSKLLAGEVGTNREFQELQALVATGDHVDAIMAGVTPDVHDASARLMANSVPMLREIGISDDAIRQVLTDHKVTKDEHRQVSEWKARQMRDPEFTKRFLSGDPAARKQMMLADIVLSGGIAEAAP